jgi:hypothetical protein
MYHSSQTTKDTSCGKHLVKRTQPGEESKSKNSHHDIDLSSSSTATTKKSSTSGLMIRKV